MLSLFEALFNSGRGLLGRLHRRLRRTHATLGPRRGPTSSSRSEIADFAKYKREFFEKYIDLSNGLPTDDTLRRSFQNLNPKSFRARFAEWASSIVHDSAHVKVVKAKRHGCNPLARSCGSRGGEMFCTEFVIKKTYICPVVC